MEWKSAACESFLIVFVAAMRHEIMDFLRTGAGKPKRVLIEFHCQAEESPLLQAVLHAAENFQLVPFNVNLGDPAWCVRQRC